MRQASSQLTSSAVHIPDMEEKKITTNKNNSNFFTL
jgi:hypothetical protein